MAHKTNDAVRAAAALAVMTQHDTDVMLTAYDQLRPTERVFVDVFCATDSPIKAMRAAQPATEERLLNLRSTDFLKRPLVQAAIAQRIKDATSKYEVTLDRTIKEIAKIGYSNIEDYIDVDEVTGLPTINLNKADRDQMSALSGFDVKELKSGTIVITPRMNDKNSALEKMMKYVGGYAASTNPAININMNGNTNNLQINSVNDTMTEAEAADVYARSLEE